MLSNCVIKNFGNNYNGYEAVHLLFNLLESGERYIFMVRLLSFGSAQPV
ncbi:MAG: hypothetical protein ACFB4I_22900 [Cyanophyceae cyanobacterium]